MKEPRFKQELEEAQELMEELEPLSTLKPGEKVATDSKVYEVVETNPKTIKVKERGNGNGPPKEMTREELGNQMKKPDSEILGRKSKPKKETPPKEKLEVKNVTKKEPVVDIMSVRPGDVLEMDDGAHLVVRGWGQSGKMGYDKFEPDVRDGGKSTFKTRSPEDWAGYQEHAAKYTRATKKIRADESPEEKEKADKALEAVMAAGEAEPPTPAAKVGQIITSRGEVARRVTAVDKEKQLIGLERIDNGEQNQMSFTDYEKAQVNIHNIQGRKELSAENKAAKESLEGKSGVPLGLKKGESIWTIPLLGEESEEIKVVDVVENPKTNDTALKGGYVVLGFQPKKGRNKVYTQEVVPFYKLEARKGNIRLTKPAEKDAEKIAKLREELTSANNVLQDIVKTERKEAEDLEIENETLKNVIKVERQYQNNGPLKASSIPRFIPFAKERKPWWKRLLGR